MHYGKDAYRIMPINDVEAIQSEIMRNGPVTVTFDVYDDLMCYGKGEFVQTAKKLWLHNHNYYCS